MVTLNKNQNPLFEFLKIVQNGRLLKSRIVIILYLHFCSSRYGMETQDSVSAIATEPQRKYVS